MKPLLVSIIFLLVSCTNSLSRSELKSVLENDSIEIKSVCLDFLSNPNLDNINIARLKDSSLCESINAWHSCENNKWNKMDIKNNRTLYLKSKEDVLKNEKITLKEYNYFKDFLVRKNLQIIKKVYQCDNCIDLESDVNGLRFSTEKNYLLNEDFEYLKVEKINDNFLSYTRDWN